MQSPSLALPATLDLIAAKTLMETFQAMLPFKGPLLIDGTQLQQVSAPGVQSLLMIAHQTTAAGGSASLEHISDDVADDLALLGISSTLCAQSHPKGLML